MFTGEFIEPCSANGRSESDSRVVVLPLNLIAQIISYLDEPGDLSRMCRTCRVLHYMTLPKLHEHVNLRSYADIRYVDGSPEGCGAASPFSMGLNGLVTRNVAPLVRSFRLWGEWKEHDVAEHAKVGRVPDGSMMLNVVVRAAIDRMTKLESFCWELNTKLLETGYHGLAARNTLQSLTIKFPSSRMPRPSCVIPPIPNLCSLKVTDIDPLCYPDDISQLLLGSKKLKHLKMHWSPRMRDNLEPSVSLHSYFGACMAANYVLPVESIAFQNLYSINPVPFDLLFDGERVRSMTAINSIGGVTSLETSFADVRWEMTAPRAVPNLRSLRIDKMAKWHAEFLDRTSDFEQLFLINPNRPTSPGTSSLLSPQSGNSPGEAFAPSLSRLYIDAIVKNHGATLRHLLLSSHWALTQEELARLVRSCPNLEQVGFSLEKSGLDLMHLLLPFLRKIHAIRVLENPNTTSDLVRSVRDALAHPEKLEEMCCDKGDEEYVSLKYIGLADDLALEVGGLVKHNKKGPDGEDRFWRPFKQVPVEQVRHLEIWAMDTLEI
ncbi:MAG: hypothetical protein M1832_002409 [Thelocarpon impressellum]|nr:MAG: hypothetical protein M1832_002409 [Thelocarpon impressellum]